MYPKRIELAFFLALAMQSAQAAATYSQSFDDVAGGIAALKSQGWIFRDQSAAVGQSWWTTGWTIDPAWAGQPSHDGPGDLAFLGQTSIQAPTTASAWAILPAVPGLTAGDVLSYYVRLQSYPQYHNGVLQVRYSPTGAVDTGSTATSIGSFTSLLTTIPVTDSSLYVNFKTVIPGPGRIALRLFHDQLPMFGVSASLQIDSLSFNPVASIPLPAPGETVTWTAAMSPILVAADIAIPKDGTVLIDPGVEVRVADGKAIEILGSLFANGTVAAPVKFTQLGLNGELRPAKGGTLGIARGIVDLRVHAFNGAAIIATDSTFLAKGGLVNAFDAQLDPAHTLLRLERCVFQGSSVQMNNLLAAVRHVDFVGLTKFDDVLLLGYVLLDDVSVDGTALWLGKANGVQPVFVDGVSVSNSTEHGGLYLYRGTNFLLGSNNTLVNNKWPVELGTSCAGLLDGSVVPVSGNQNDYVIDTDDFDPQTTVTWGALAVPYVVRIPRFLGHQTIRPGAHVKFMADCGFESEFFGDLDAIGTEDEPIVFERFDPAQQWKGIRMFKPTHGQRLEHCIFRGAERGVTSDDVQFDSCTFEDCATGIFTGAYALGRSCRFYGNDIGVDGFLTTSGPDGSVLMNGLKNPSAFSGNTIAVRASESAYPNDARFDWWGHASGPFHPTQNPQGQGDPIQPLGPISFQPFLTAAPDFTDSPPHVEWWDGRILVADPGKTVLLSWNASDDGSIVGQRVLFSSNGNSPGQMTLLATQVSPGQRTFAFTVPSVGVPANGVSAFLRIEATDQKGQISSDDLEFYITQPDLQGSAQLVDDPAGATFVPGDHLDLAYTLSGMGPQSPPTITGSLFLDNDGTAIGLGGAGIGQPIPLGLAMPEVSTDRARIALVFRASLNQQKIFFSEPFSIRPPQSLGDAPPAITLTSPRAGDAVLSGSSVPIRWEASDDQGLRSFDIRVSTDGGHRWNDVVLGLGANARAYDWALPSNVALDDVRLLVIAHDTRFQNSSDLETFRIVAGVSCQSNLGFGSPGGPFIAICGAPLSSGKTAAFVLTGAPASQPGFLLISTSLNPTPLLGGIVATLPVVASIPFATGTGGQLSISSIAGGGGPFTFYVQAIVAKPQALFGATLSNALAVQMLP